MSAGMPFSAATLAPAAAAGSPPPLPPNGAPGAPAPGGGPAMMPNVDPTAGVPVATGNPYPTTDPNFMTQVFSQLMQMRDADHQTMSQNQDSAMQQSPLFQALIGGAPLGPGAGQDGQGIGVDATSMPDQPPASVAPAQMRGA